MDSYHKGRPVVFLPAERFPSFLRPLFAPRRFERDDADCDNAIAPVRAIQQVEAYLLSGVAVLKSYMTTGARITATEILSLMSQVSECFFPEKPTHFTPLSASSPVQKKYLHKIFGHESPQKNDQGKSVHRRQPRWNERDVLPTLVDHPCVARVWLSL